MVVAVVLVMVVVRRLALVLWLVVVELLVVRGLRMARVSGQERPSRVLTVRQGGRCGTTPVQRDSESGSVGDEMAVDD